MTELKPMTAVELAVRLLPISRNELRNGSKIERDKLRLDLGIITAFLASSRCDDPEDREMYLAAENDLRVALKAANESLSPDAFDELRASLTYFVGFVSPGLSDSIEDALVVT